MDDNWENEGGTVAQEPEEDCTLCGEPGATYPSGLGGFLCEDPVKCLQRASLAPNG